MNLPSYKKWCNCVCISKQILSLLWSVVLLVLWLPILQICTSSLLVTDAEWRNYCTGMRNPRKENPHHALHPVHSECVHIKCLKVRLCLCWGQERQNIHDIVFCPDWTQKTSVLTWFAIPTFCHAGLSAAMGITYVPKLEARQNIAPYSHVGYGYLHSAEH